MAQNGKRLIDLTNDKVSDSKIIKQLRKDVKERDDLIGALSNENAELSAKLDKWIKLQENGYSWVAEDVNNGVILSAGTVLPFARFIYTQEIPIEIGMQLYKSFPFYKITDGKIDIDIQKYNKYKGVI